MLKIKTSGVEVLDIRLTQCHVHYVLYAVASSIMIVLRVSGCFQVIAGSVYNAVFICNESVLISSVNIVKIILRNIIMRDSVFGLYCKLALHLVSSYDVCRV